MRENFYNFHTVIVFLHTVSHFLCKNIVKSTFLWFLMQKILNTYLVDLTKYFLLRVNFSFFHTVQPSKTKIKCFLLLRFISFCEIKRSNFNPRQMKLRSNFFVKSKNNEPIHLIKYSKCFLIEIFFNSFLLFLFIMVILRHNLF